MSAAIVPLHHPTALAKAIADWLNGKRWRGDRTTLVSKKTDAESFVVDVILRVTIATTQ